MQLLIYKIVGNASTTANGRFPISGWIPGKTDARLEVHPLIFDTGLTVETRIARIVEARGSVRNHLVDNVLAEAVHAEVEDGILLELHREVRIPAHAVIHRQPLADLPRVLRIQPEETLVVDQPGRSGLLRTGYLSRQEIGHPQTGCLPGERVSSNRKHVRQGIHGGERG